MSLQLINHSPDLQKLRNEGYEIDIISGYLVMSNVPYVTRMGQVQRGRLISELTLRGDKTTRPNTHVVSFDGEYPCDRNGVQLTKIVNSSSSHTIAPGLIAKHTFSSKPTKGYADYYEKMTTYCAILEGPARSLNPKVTAKTFRVIENREQQSVFKYLDTASSRAAITAVTDKLKLDKVAIIGLGGTGSYVLDFVAKTPVREIHLYDGDKYLQHNAFRSPGASSAGELNRGQKKVKYFRNKYSKMHNGIIAHDCYLDEHNVDDLKSMAFVFLCMDRGEAKCAIIEALEDYGVPFVDTGMGLYEVDGALGGVIRTTTSTQAMRDHVIKNQRIPLGPANDNNEYDQNIQIVELNALNAAMAVMKWKKLFSFYQDFEEEHFSAFTIDGNVIINEDKL